MAHYSARRAKTENPDGRASGPSGGRVPAGGRGTLWGMRKTAAAILLSLTLGGCFFGEEPGPDAYGLNSAVLVYNYANAFRDYLRAAEENGGLPPHLRFRLPLEDQDWSIGDAPSPVPVTVTVDGIVVERRTVCGPQFCVRDIERRFERGDMRTDETVTVSYLRGATGPADDRVLGFTAQLRYRDQAISDLAATAPTDAGPWVVRQAVTFMGQDRRVQMIRTARYAEMVSEAVPASLSWTLMTKEDASGGTLLRDAEGWTYAEAATYESNTHLKSARAEMSLQGDSLRIDRLLAYADGREIPLSSLSGEPSSWIETGETYMRADVSGTRTATEWRRTQVFPAGQRFTKVEDTGTLPRDGRGTFTRHIEGTSETGDRQTLTWKGTVREKIPGVWEVTAVGSDLRLQFTYQAFDFHEHIAGIWSQTNGVSATFEIRLDPDWTGTMNYVFNHPDTVWDPDEFGSLRMMPDTRGEARVSVVLGQWDEETQHTDRNFIVVAEGKRP